MLRTLPVVLLALFLVAAEPASSGQKPFTIRVVDEQTGGGVPLVELKTTGQVAYFTDSNGIVAFDEPGLMDQTVYFAVKSPGYEYPKDAFGYRGKALKITPGGKAELKIKRINIAERLYRVTGAGIYADSVRVGEPVPTKRPVLNGLVFGSDSVVNTLYQGKLYWFWGDTNQPAYPLGNFNVPGAISLLPDKGGLDPERGIDLEYFVGKKGFAKEMAPVAGSGPTWIGGLMTVNDKDGRERMFAGYVKVQGQLDIYERGIVEYNDAKQQFEKIAKFPLDAPGHPFGHPFAHKVDGVDYIYFATPLPVMRVPADVEAITKPERYEIFTCLKEGSRLADGRLDRGSDGLLRYGWKKNTAPMGSREQAKWIKGDKLKAEEALFQLQDPDTGKAMNPHGGSVFWNPYRQRWVLLTVEGGGTSFLGEMWYAEAESPLGPWVYARKIATHPRYSFYNPKQHPYFDKEAGRVVFFEGTYTHSFSGNNEQTPRYDYNQLLYKLDLAEPRLMLPSKKVQLGGGSFLALDRAAKDTQPVYETQTSAGTRRLQFGPPPTASSQEKPLFYALPADAKNAPSTTVPLYEFTQEKGDEAIYSTDPNWNKPGFKRKEQPLCRVWRNPVQIELPKE